MAALAVACTRIPLNTGQERVQEGEEQAATTPQTLDFQGPPVFIYKTKGDYFDLVPVSLLPDKSAIAAYPAPSDLYTDGQPNLPTRLADGYLLDNRGIDANVAFLDWTYIEYGGLDALPTIAVLYAHIKDNDPLTALYHCGSRYQFTAKEQYDVLVKERFVRCKRIK